MTLYHGGIDRFRQKGLMGQEGAVADVNLEVDLDRALEGVARIDGAALVAHSLLPVASFTGVQRLKGRARRELEEDDSARQPVAKHAQPGDAGQATSKG